MYVQHHECQCLAKLLSKYYIKGATFEHLGLLFPTPNLSIQIIIFTFTHDKYIHQTLEIKQNKYNPLINAIQTQGWKVNPLKVITLGVRGAIHTNIVEELKNLQIPMSSILLFKKNMKVMHQTTIKYLMYLVLNENYITNKYPYYPQRGNSPHYPN